MKNDALHILIMSSWYPTRKDAYLGNFVERFAEAISEKNRVTILHLQSDENCKDVEIEETNTGQLRTLIIYYPKTKKLFRKWKIQKRLLQIGLNQISDVDVVFGHVLFPRVNQFILAKKHFQCPLLVLEHGSYFRSSYPLGKVQKWWLKHYTKGVDRLLACSPVLQQDLQQFFPKMNIGILPNIIDETFFQLRNKEIGNQHFVHISTLDPLTKHPELILHALESILKSHPNVKLSILSDQPTHHLKELAYQLKIMHAVEFNGPFTSMEIGNELRSHDALILSSSYETFGIVIAESWLCGTPVISTPVGIAKNLAIDAGIQISSATVDAILAAWLLFIDIKKDWDTTAIRQHGIAFTKTEVMKKLNSELMKLTNN